MKIIRAFEDAGALAGVSRPLEGLTGDFQLLIDVRKFQLSLAGPPTAEVEFSAKVLDDKGRIASTRIFLASAPAKGSDAPPPRPPSSRPSAPPSSISSTGPPAPSARTQERRRPRPRRKGRAQEEPALRCQTHRVRHLSNDA